ncbi:MAG: ACP S-malonyltransferase [Magnetococcales bacterium]|nr:ACP S-malonyltransferase [Magnetococcales bacterium]
MGKTAFLFPGQGSQAVGMGKALREAGGAAAATLTEADEALGFSLTGLMFDGPAETLTLTENTQPALVTTGVAAFRLVCERTGARPDYVAGHSLGEYAALCAAGALSFADAVRLVRLRGEAMRHATPPGVGGMAAMLNMTREDVEAVCRDAAAATGEVCVPANFNGPGQIVISGHKGAVERAMALAKERGARRCLALPVAAPFHSPLMAPAAQRMAEALAGVAFQELSVPLVANVTAAETSSGEVCKRLLVEQVTGSVRWEESMRRLLELGVDAFVEVGTGKVLSGLIKRIDDSVRVFTLNGPEDLAALDAL